MRDDIQGQGVSRTLLKKLDQLYVAVLVVVTLVILASWWAIKGGLRGDLVDIERAAPLHYDFLVDLNAAEWPELAQLPDVGEVLARRIVASRGIDGPFNRAEDLLRVNGIGSRRLAKVRGYLSPLPGERVMVDDR